MSPEEEARRAALPEAARRALAEADARRAAGLADPDLPTELGGRDGPEPVRYGDWEKKGLAIDF
ncbi:dihydrodipicolinate reductase [Pseudaestuariivita atlantica]|uniref:Dihydrodipicolinate reductase n=1 Tax=Pseudaestuariivita atlantica TaxID=1317121 RepID=A0A0L1JUI3_9RHOB|nr:dihydrodipicolinate reductase [Pseudaestuariivita atlantica]